MASKKIMYVISSHLFINISRHYFNKRLQQLHFSISWEFDKTPTSYKRSMSSRFSNIHFFNPKHFLACTMYNFGIFYGILPKKRYLKYWKDYIFNI